MALTAIAALCSVISTAPAHGQTGTAELVPARVFAGWTVYPSRGYTKVNQLVLWNGTPGAQVLVYCGQGRGPVTPYPCPLVPDPSSFATVRTFPASGVLDLTRLFRRTRLAPGGGPAGLFIHTSPPGVYPDLTKGIEWVPRRRALPATNRYCAYTLSKSHDGSRLSCTSPCPPPPRLQFSNHCAGAGQLLPPPLFAAASRAARGGGVRISRLDIGGLALQPPFSNPGVAIFCRGRGCPFGARFFAGSGGSRQIKSFGRRVLRPGTVVEIWVIKANFIGRVQRYEVKRRRLVASSLCAYPTKLRPQRCPPGQ